MQFTFLAYNLTLSCGHTLPDSSNGRRTDKKIRLQNLYPFCVGWYTYKIKQVGNECLTDTHMICNVRETEKY